MCSTTWPCILCIPRAVTYAFGILMVSRSARRQSSSVGARAAEASSRCETGGSIDARSPSVPRMFGGCWGSVEEG
eukprot:8261747-Pyramimonas_sp.AAC.1